MAGQRLRRPRHGGQSSPGGAGLVRPWRRGAQHEVPPLRRDLQECRQLKTAGPARLHPAAGVEALVTSDFWNNQRSKACRGDIPRVSIHPDSGQERGVCLKPWLCQTFTLVNVSRMLQHCAIMANACVLHRRN